MDIIRFLNDHNIPYVTHGPNVGRGEIGIKCPFCGVADPSEHLSWNPNNGYWICRRNPSKHYGRKPHRLIIHLINCSYEQADLIAGGGQELTATIKSSLLKRLSGEKKFIPKSEPLVMPKEFRPLTTKGIGRYFTDYLIDKRGFRPRDIPALVEEYDLRFCTTGNWRNRLIFPLYFERQLVCWTGRSIASKVAIRYLSLGTDNMQFKALLTPKELVYHYDLLLEQGGQVLFITEGPIDALKMDFYAKAYGARATCLFGTGITEDQVVLLSQLRQRFEDLVVFGDKGAFANVRYLMGFGRLQLKRAELPTGVSDPANLTRQQVRAIIKRHI